MRVIPYDPTASLAIQAPTPDDVFLAKTGRTLEGAAEEPDEVAQPDAQPDFA